MRKEVGFVKYADAMAKLEDIHTTTMNAYYNRNVTSSATCIMKRSLALSIHRVVADCTDCHNITDFEIKKPV